MLFWAKECSTCSARAPGGGPEASLPAWAAERCSGMPLARFKCAANVRVASMTACVCVTCIHRVVPSAHDCTVRRKHTDRYLQQDHVQGMTMKHHDHALGFNFDRWERDDSQTAASPMHIHTARGHSSWWIGAGLLRTHLDACQHKVDLQAAGLHVHPI